MTAPARTDHYADQVLDLALDVIGQGISDLEHGHVTDALGVIEWLSFRSDIWTDMYDEPTKRSALKSGLRRRYGAHVLADREALREVLVSQLNSGLRAPPKTARGKELRYLSRLYLRAISESESDERDGFEWLLGVLRSTYDCVLLRQMQPLAEEPAEDRPRPQPDPTLGCSQGHPRITEHGSYVRRHDGYWEWRCRVCRREKRRAKRASEREMRGVGDA